MQHYTNLKNIQAGDTWLTIGSFDGVHQGHQYLISNLVNSAHQAGALAMAMTFQPHPAVVLRGLNTPYFLSTPEEKLEQLASLGLDAVITLEFTREFANHTAPEFIQMLTSAVRLKQLWVGKDFALGKDRVGNLDYLADLGRQMGWMINSLPPMEKDGVKISSSLIRCKLKEGDIAGVNELLGRSYSVAGEVTHGEGRGHLLGFPTANVQVPYMRLLPARGVYACKVELDDAVYKTVANIGLRPTFTDGQAISRLEAHILDYSGDLYHRKIRVEFIQRLREEKKFTSVQELMDQVQTDIRHARQELT
jgi:riboflavin kinase / FMN adenylyltransferase